jgi:2-oxoglutarate ferredoxin oxidoreductase subunit alpha
MAAMTETPVVIVDVQRGGPSTGMPTKHEQSDLNAMVYGTHGEAAKIVLAPSSIEDCFYDMMEAFNLAEEYQCPVIVMTDLQLGMGKQSCNQLDMNLIPINRGKLQTGELPELPAGELFKRYAFTEDGISPRTIPGMKNGVHHVTGNEHDTGGRPQENAENRRKMVEKRLGKLSTVHIRDAIRVDAPHDDADLLIVTMGSNDGTVDAARKSLEADGVKTNRIIVRQILPFPTDDIAAEMAKAKKVVVVENNATGQLANQIRLHIGSEKNLEHVLKYNGNPFLPSEVYNGCKEVL